MPGALVLVCCPQTSSKGITWDLVRNAVIGSNPSPWIKHFGVGPTSVPGDSDECLSWGTTASEAWDGVRYENSFEKQVPLLLKRCENHWPLSESVNSEIWIKQEIYFIMTTNRTKITSCQRNLSFFKSSPKDILTDFREREGREGEGGKQHCESKSSIELPFVCTPSRDRTHNLGLGTEPAALRFRGQGSNQLSHTGPGGNLCLKAHLVNLYSWGIYKRKGDTEKDTFWINDINVVIGRADFSLAGQIMRKTQD